MPLLLAFCACTFFLSNSLPSGFIPAEDQGMIYAIIQTPPGSTLERTNQIARELLKESEDVDGVKSVSSLAGYEILTEGTGSNSGTCLINLKSWDERKESAAEIIEKLEEKAKNIPGANIEFFQPPSIPGYGAAGGFELRLLDKAGSGDYHKMEQVSNDFVKELKNVRNSDLPLPSIPRVSRSICFVWIMILQSRKGLQLQKQWIICLR